MDSLAVWLIGAKYRYIFPEHLNYFTPETMRKFVELEFTPVGMKSTHFNPLVIWKDFRGGEKDVPRAERVKLLKQTTGYKKSRWMFPSRLHIRQVNSCWGNLCWQITWRSWDAKIKRRGIRPNMADKPCHLHALS